MLHMIAVRCRWNKKGRVEAAYFRLSYMEPPIGSSVRLLTTFQKVGLQQHLQRLEIIVRTNGFVAH